MKCKYLIINHNGVNTPILLPLNGSHSPHGFRLRNVISAGEAEYDGKEWNCYGKSSTLNIRARPGTDNEILNNFYS